MLSMCFIVEIGQDFFSHTLSNTAYFPRRLSSHTFDLLLDISQNGVEQTSDCSWAPPVSAGADSSMQEFKLPKPTQTLTRPLKGETVPTNQFGHTRRIQRRWELAKELDVPPVVFQQDPKPKTTYSDWKCKDCFQGEFYNPGEMFPEAFAAQPAREQGDLCLSVVKSLPDAFSTQALPWD